jgi:hypothetical protein
VEHRDQSGDGCDTALVSVELVEDLGDVEDRERDHRGGDQEEHPGSPAEPDRSREAERGEDGEDDERSRLEVDPEDLLIGFAARLLSSFGRGLARMRDRFVVIVL